ncbi:MAG: hemolysin family protein [Phycisphaerales bacterium]
MTLLVFYLVLAIGVSFLCSLVEAAILTLTVSDAEVMIKNQRRGGERLKALKTAIDRPLAAILTLNTIAHTVGAAGVGAQSLVVFGDKWVAATSAVLTLLVLVLSEIVPKTIGATYAKRLAFPAVVIIVGMIWVTYPVVLILDALTRLLKGGHGHGGPTRETIEVMAEMARQGGAIDADESALMRNMLKLRATRVKDIMTPRTVVQMVDAGSTVAQIAASADSLPFSRLPVSGDGPDDIRGMVLKDDMLQAIANGKPETTVADLMRPILPIPEVTTALRAMKRFRVTGEHLLLVVDEFGGTEGIVTLEDLLEEILGSEIVDETDAVPDMRALAMQTEGSDRAREALKSMTASPDRAAATPAEDAVVNQRGLPPAASETPGDSDTPPASR